MSIKHKAVAENVSVAGCLSVYVERIIREPLQERRPSIIFVNGAMATTRSYRWAVGMLSDFDLVLYDPPNVGQSSGRLEDSSSGVSLELEAKVLAELNDIYRPDYLVSLSWGGVSAIQLLASQPANLKKAVLASLTDRLTPPMIQCVTAVRECLDSGKVHDAIDVFAGTLGSTLSGLVQRAHTRYFRTRVGDPREVEYFRRLCELVSTLDVEKMREQARRVRCECLLVNGALDEYTPAADAKHLAELIPNSRCCVVEGVGHFLAVESEAAYRSLQREVTVFLGQGGEATTKTG
jgi:rhamnosyltransferase subunit A